MAFCEVCRAMRFPRGPILASTSLEETVGPWTICKCSLFPQHIYRLGLVGGTHLVLSSALSSARPGSLLFLFLLSVGTETLADQGCPAFPSLFQPLVEINRVYQRTCV